MNNEEKILVVLGQMQAETNQRFDKMQAETNQRFDKLDDYVQAIHQLVNDDHALLRAVSEKVDRLANVTEDHDGVIQKLRAL